jgi:hypothetical protein
MQIYNDDALYNGCRFDCTEVYGLYVTAVIQRLGIDILCGGMY